MQVQCAHQQIAMNEWILKLTFASAYLRITKGKLWSDLKLRCEEEREQWVHIWNFARTPYVSNTTLFLRINKLLRRILALSTSRHSSLRHWVSTRKLINRQFCLLFSFFAVGIDMPLDSFVIVDNECWYDSAHLAGAHIHLPGILQWVPCAPAHTSSIFVRSINADN